MKLLPALTLALFAALASAHASPVAPGKSATAAFCALLLASGRPAHPGCTTNIAAAFNSKPAVPLGTALTPEKRASVLDALREKAAALFPDPARGADPLDLLQRPESPLAMPLALDEFIAQWERATLDRTTADRMVYECSTDPRCDSARLLVAYAAKAARAQTNAQLTRLRGRLAGWLTEHYTAAELDKAKQEVAKKGADAGEAVRRGAKALGDAAGRIAEDIIEGIRRGRRQGGGIMIPVPIPVPANEGRRRQQQQHQQPQQRSRSIYDPHYSMERVPGDVVGAARYFAEWLAILG